MEGLLASVRLEDGIPKLRLGWLAGRRAWLPVGTGGSMGHRSPRVFFLGLQRELEEEKINSPPSIFWGAVPCWAFGGSDLQRVDALSVVFWIWGPH